VYCPFDRTARLMVACEKPNSRASCRCDFTVWRRARQPMKPGMLGHDDLTWSSVSAPGRPIVLLPAGGVRDPTAGGSPGEGPPRAGRLLLHGSDVVGWLRRL
jgi:hypothetical protein